MKATRPIILILGPTAGGKTALAVALARALPGGGECISADSMQVYRGMDIGTAKPTPAERAAVPHHLLDIVDPSEEGFSVDTWLDLAEAAIARIRARGRWPIVVGGTNLYAQALLAGLFDGPEPDPDLRRSLQAMDAEALRRQLREIDPPAAERIHPNDRKRTIRAIEVHELTGRRLSDLQQQWDSGRIRPDVRIIGLHWPVEAINRRINARVKAMIEGGFVEEVRRLWENDRLGRQAREALGYRQIVDHLEGRLTLVEATEQIKIRTRRLAKQQRTWLRRFRQHGQSAWLEAGGRALQELVKYALSAIHEDVPARASAPGERGNNPPQAGNCP
ncbi:MAG: tRNA (adenosine(37)-N6)-dimethylallyltransferase MiaA [Planctomycetota bacterium]|nr:tRNA (adenosine(37)-N6)-dimethylallyltransferase MiaA [Planctomycetota bacterium]